MGIRAKTTSLRKAIFLDRDGVINENVLNPKTKEWESPHCPKDFRLITGALKALKLLQDKSFLLFLISNQPSYAKGKASMESIMEIQREFENKLKSQNIRFSEFYYCYHHPHGLVPGYSFACQCRKPNTFFIEKAKEEFGVDLKQSWMIGDRATDIECGRRAGLKTILIKPDMSQASICRDQDFDAPDLASAAEIIVNINEN